MQAYVYIDSHNVVLRYVITQFLFLGYDDRYIHIRIHGVNTLPGAVFRKRSEKKKERWTNMSCKRQLALGREDLNLPLPVHRGLGLIGRLVQEDALAEVELARDELFLRLSEIAGGGEQDDGEGVAGVGRACEDVEGGEAGGLGCEGRGGTAWWKLGEGGGGGGRESLTRHD